LIAHIVADPTTDLAGRIAYASLFRSTLNEQLIVFRAVIRVLTKEHREDRVVAENIGIVVRISGDGYCRRGRGLLERHASEGDGIFVGGQVKQQLTHVAVPLDDVSETVEAGIIEHVANNIGVDACCYSSS